MIRIGDKVLYNQFIHNVVTTVIVEAEGNKKYIGIVPVGSKCMESYVEESEVIKL
jgi:hypothetical protein